MILGAGIDVTLPGGTWQNGVRLERARLRPLATADELFVAEAGGSLLPAQRISVLLQRCISLGDAGDGGTQPDFRILTAGDRDAILLHLRRLSFGNLLDCVFSCRDCGEVVEIELSIDELLVSRYPESSPEIERRFELQGNRVMVRLRPPSVDDLHEVAPLARRNVEQAVDALLERCIHRFEVNGTITPIHELPPEAKERLDALLLETDPQAELILNGDCPQCGQPYRALLDPGSFLMQELAAAADAFYLDVLTLAGTYHWSEREILELPPARRRRYLELTQRGNPAENDR